LALFPPAREVVSTNGRNDVRPPNPAHDPESGLSAPKSGKMRSLKKLLHAAHQLLLLDKALAWGLPRPQRSAFFVLRRHTGTGLGPGLPYPGMPYHSLLLVLE
jgi:hypothetical protein